MSAFVTLTCPSCGGKLQITNDIDRFACGHCGNEHVVKRSGGIVALAPVVEGLAKVQMGVDKTASELAMVRLTKELPDLRDTRQQAALQANQASDRKKKTGCQLGGCGITCLLLAGLALVAMTRSTGSAEATNSGVGIGFFALVGFGMLWARRWYLRAVAREEGDAKSLALSLDKQIASKEAELEHHRQMVSLER
jgi:hypothetical protein